MADVPNSSEPSTSQIDGAPLVEALPAGIQRAPEGASYHKANLEYLFSIGADVVARYVGEIEGGYRIDLEYSAGKSPITFSAGTSLGTEAIKLLNGATILSGIDWAVVSDDAVADFDSRITLRLNAKVPRPKGKKNKVQDGAGDAGQRCLIAGRFRGRGDLRDAHLPGEAPLFDKDADPIEVLTAWQQGFADGTMLPLSLAVSFDVPIEGFDDDQTAVYDRCREIGRSVLLGIGHATFGPGTTGQVKRIDLDVVRVAKLYNVGKKKPGNA